MLDGMQLHGFVAGDDDAAEKKALDFVKAVGFRPIDASRLGMARALEALAALYIHLQVKHSWPWQSGWKLAGTSEDAKHKE